MLDQRGFAVRNLNQGMQFLRTVRDNVEDSYEARRQAKNDLRVLGFKGYLEVSDDIPGDLEDRKFWDIL